jgi:hypothetical protein
MDAEATEEVDLAEDAEEDMADSAEVDTAASAEVVVASAEGMEALAEDTADTEVN